MLSVPKQMDEEMGKKKVKNFALNKMFLTDS